ncbi:hypothetical protein CFC21_071583 [Triticum aestivum]|uniref:Uncharacterized protein n=2 Tax=Triticum aestivum TaxID=4565 RepID=A0A9R1KT83_WHEAT|nr:hypothetical protein CFC21_071583 [Triticum aestivum]
MKKIKSGKELVEEVRKIEKNINAINTISSLPELSVAGISLEVCEVPTPSHSAEQDSESPEEEIRQIQEEILEAKAQDDPELEQQSDQVEDPSSITLEEAKEVDVIEDEEPETHLPIVIQERDLAGLSNPLYDMLPYEIFAATFHCVIPSIKLDLKNYLLGHDHTYFPYASPMLNETYYSRPSLELNDKFHPHVSLDLADFYHPKHVIYSYAYVIGYSIDDLEGITPTTCIVSFVESAFRFLLVRDPLHADQV